MSDKSARQSERLHTFQVLGAETRRVVEAAREARRFAKALKAKAKVMRLIKRALRTGQVPGPRPDESARLAHSLVPLKLAAELIFSKVYEGRTIAARAPLLDSIASTISVLSPIYEYNTDPSRPPRLLTRMEIEGGMFRGGAEQMRFIDGRPPLSSLAVSADDLAATIDALKNAGL